MKAKVRGGSGRGRAKPRSSSRNGASNQLERGAKAAKRRGKMPQTARTKTEAEMNERLRALDPGSLRHRVLRTAIDFKKSWLDLAEHLNEISKSGVFKEWGYRTFEAYGQHELHLRRETALKLTRSFDFLSAHERDLLEAARTAGGEAAPIPGYQALDVLAEARTNPHLSERDYREIRDQVFDDDLSPAQVKKLLRDRAPEPLKEEREDGDARLRRCLQLAERLYGLLLEEGDVPDRITRSIEDAIGGLRRLIEE